MRSFQEIESREVQDQPAPGTKHSMHFVERERVIHAGVTQDIERKDEVEGAVRKGKCVDGRWNQLCAEVAPGRKFQGMLALIYSG